jgi:hypothetical protein
MKSIDNPHDGHVSQRGASEFLIRVDGLLSDEWYVWFEGLTIERTDDGTTMIRGRVEDQARLFGILNKIRDLGIPLLSVWRVGAADADSE